MVRINSMHLKVSHATWIEPRTATLEYYKQDEGLLKSRFSIYPSGSTCNILVAQTLVKQIRDVCLVLDRMSPSVKIKHAKCLGRLIRCLIEANCDLDGILFVCAIKLAGFCTNYTELKEIFSSMKEICCRHGKWPTEGAPEPPEPRNARPVVSAFFGAEKKEKFTGLPTQTMKLCNGVTESKLLWKYFQEFTGDGIALDSEGLTLSTHCAYSMCRIEKAFLFKGCTHFSHLLEFACWSGIKLLKQNPRCPVAGCTTKISLTAPEYVLFPMISQKLAEFKDTDVDEIIITLAPGNKLHAVPKETKQPQETASEGLEVIDLEDDLEEPPTKKVK